MVWESVSQTVVAEDGTETAAVVMEPAYDMRYLAAEGDLIELILKEEYEKRKAEGVTEGLWRAAFMGCTYHCG
jgi:hypothetical protein